MITKCEQKIMEVVLPQPFKSYSVRNLSKLINSSYALTYDSVKTLIKKGMIRTERIGTTISCRADLSADPQLLAISSLTHSQKLLSKAKYGFMIDEIKQNLQSLYLLILFGSRVKGTQKKNSDIDLLFVMQNKLDIEQTKKRIRSLLSSTNLNIEFDVITTEWLVKMFDEKQSLGREVLNASIILHGAEQYYTLVNIYDKKRGY